MKAAYRGDDVAVQRILATMPRRLVFATDEQGWTALNYALQGRQSSLTADVASPPGDHEAVVARLVSAGMASDSACPIYYAVALRNIAALRLLVDAQSPEDLVTCLQQRDHNNDTALHLLALSKASGFARLFRNGVDPATAKAFRLLDIAPPTLHKHEHQPLQHDTFVTRHMLEEATSASDIRLLAPLHSHGLGCDERDSLGRTPLHIAAFSGRSPAATSALLDVLGCDVAAVDNDGNTPLHLAVAQGFCDTTNALLLAPHGFALNNSANARRVTPAYLASRPPFSTVCGNRWRDDRHAAAAGDGDGDAAARSREPSPWTCAHVDASDINDTASFLAEYVHLAQPVVIRNYLSHWPAHAAAIRLASLAASSSPSSPSLGDAMVSVAAVPYASTYGHSTTHTMPLRTFVQQHMGYSNNHHQHHQQQAQDCRTTDTCMYVFDGSVLHRHPEMLHSIGLPFVVSSTEQLVLAQLMVGPTGSGAPPHFHGQAINVLVQGRKQWQLFPPQHAFFHMVTAHAWFARDTATTCFDSDGGGGGGGGGCRQVMMTCEQKEGDALFVPASWGHAVLNEAPVVAAAFEFRG
ncbi:hypothetical protein PTSG_01914 [Salpingoeca rosetta]|uniref:JmjC domain-containing protein n=1 Tax=Salpingoeca rosetta (strain ATCC 50818 / BSB-021) TaxID=946362 RepID=F2TZB6_SALR5|nr:uncharacterized protein PTSG_01914 [Salpingoeca rosetta]EGD78940.1 hypothetical protein PTSG_01914 [Salpingoeca rosetta]|eukprot:XP_004997896.1 hypothetical protein PTSG_01914 [Salpingoeca rosetta]